MHQAGCTHEYTQCATLTYSYLAAHAHGKLTSHIDIIPIATLADTYYLHTAHLAAPSYAPRAKQGYTHILYCTVSIVTCLLSHVTMAYSVRTP